MSQLIIEFENIAVQPEVLAALRQTLIAGGCDAGMFFVGALNRAPDTVYILWHLRGELPISMLIQGTDLDDEKSARTTAEDFLMKWSQRDN
jgi:hypothetical protein